jgi:hypothetical protein
MKGEGPDSCAVLTASTSGHPLSGATGAMEDHPTSIQVRFRIDWPVCDLVIGGSLCLTQNYASDLNRDTEDCTWITSVYTKRIGN